MSFSGRHGVGSAERERAQRFKVDIEADVDLSEAGRTDRLTDTIDYRQMRAIAKRTIEGESVNLIETLATRIAEGHGRDCPHCQPTRQHVAHRGRCRAH